MNKIIKKCLKLEKDFYPINLASKITSSYTGSLRNFKSNKVKQQGMDSINNKYSLDV